MEACDGIDGLILATARLSHPLIETLAAGDLPLVLVNRRREGLPLARLWENKSALLSLGLNKKGKPGLWIVQKIR